MSKRELQRVNVLAQVDDGRLGIDAGAGILGVSRRQMLRLPKRHRGGGAASIRHASRGRTAGNRIHDARRDLSLSLVREHFTDSGPTLAAEKLAKLHGIRVSRETLRKWMAEAEIWLPRRQRHRIRQPRLRRDALGELIQPLGTLPSAMP